MIRKGCNLIGCSDFAISMLEKDLGVKLPAEYRLFLKLMGKDAGAFMKGSSAFYKDLFDLKGYLIEVFDDEDWKFPDNIVVFFSHQGYQYAWFSLDAGDDPSVYYYEAEAGNKMENTGKTFSEFLKMQLIMSGLE